MQTLPAEAATPQPYPVSYNFLQNTFKIGLSLSAPGLNDWNCHPSAAHPRPVVLVHGTGGNQASNWLTYSTLLANHGYCVYGLTYGEAPELAASPYHVGGMADMVASAGQLQKFVVKVLGATGASQIDLIGHSQGTLMPNYWVRFLSGAHYVKNYVSLASLWH
ncbi:MAG: lipase, partial [Aeromicrobium sp.]